MTQNDPAQPSVSAWIQSVRPTPLWFVILAIVVYFVLAYLGNLVANPARLLPSLPAATGHVISPTFLNYVPNFAVLGLLFVLVGRLRCHDLGLVRRQLLPAVAWVGGTWIAAQLAFVLTHLGNTSLDPAWHGQVIKKISDLVTGQLLGNALYEDVFWRAFVISQLALLLTHRMKKKFSTALTWAVLISTVLFALSHVPIDIARELTTQEIIVGQAVRLAGGVVCVATFLLSNNLFTAIGIHALIDRPTSLFEGGNDELMQTFIAIGPLLVLSTLAICRRRAGSTAA